jgi:thioredoxin 1
MLVVKKFSATYCGPCRALAPVMNEIKSQFSGVKFEEYDVDNFPHVAEKCRVSSVPTVIIEKDGLELERFTGLSSKMAYINAINERLK